MSRAIERLRVRPLCDSEFQRLPPLAWAGAVLPVPLTAS